MEQPLEEALELTDDIIDTVQQQPSPARPTPSGEKSLHEKLYAIYVEECEKESEVEGLRSNVKLLEKLMKKELSCLVVNLYPENQGYSLMIKDKDGVLIESFPVPYVGPKLLKYLDAEELPPFLIDVLEKSPVNVFHHGCVIAEIRDYRQGSNIYPPGELGAEPAVLPAVSPPAYQSRHILLHPTMQSLVSDVHSITSDNQQWAEEEKLEPESQLISASAEPLCLEPSVAVTHMASRLLFNEQKMMTDSLRQCFMRQEWPYLEQDDEQHLCTTPPDVDTMVACRKRAEIKPGDKYDLKIAEAGKCVDTWKQRPCELVAPEEVDVHKYARGKPSVPLDDSKSTAWSTPEVNFDDIFDCEEGSQPWETKSSMTQSFSDPFLSPEIDSSTEGRSDKQLFLPQVAPSDCSLGSPAGEMIESGKAVGACQGSVQSKAECLGTMLQRSTDSISLGQSSLGIESGTAVGACQGSVQSKAECLGTMLQRSTDSISLGQSSLGIESGTAVGACQGSVQSKAECLGTMLQRSTDSISLGQSSLGIESGTAVGACQGSVQSKAECLGTMLQRSTDSISLGQSSLGIESGTAVGACQGSVQSKAECLGTMLQRSTDSISLGQSSLGIESGTAVGACQGSVQSKAECLGTMLQRSTDSISLGQSSLGIESGTAVGACQGSVQSKAECLGTMLQRSTDSISLGQSSLGIESGKAVGACQGSVQSRAECLGIMLQRSTDSISLGQSSPGKRAIPHVVASPVLERRVRTTGPLLTPPSSSGRGFLADNRPSVSLRGKKLPRLVLSSRSASPAQQAFSGMRSVNTLSPPVQPSASSSESNPATQGPSSGTGQNVFNLFSLAQGAPVLMSSPSQVQRFPTGAPASTETSSTGFFPPRAQMPSTRPRAPHRSVHTSLKLIVKNTSGPVTVRLPPGSVILHPESQAQQQQPRLQPQQPQQQPQLQLQQPRQPQQQPHLQSQQPQQQPWLLPQQQQPWLLPQQQQQPWLLPQQQQPWLLPQQPQQQSQSQLHSQPQQQPERLYVLIPKPQQPPRAPVPRQPVPPACSLGSNIPQRVLLAQQVRLFNLAEARRIFQPQTTVVCQVGSTHQRPGQNLPSQSFQHPAAQVEQLQARGHNVQLRFLPRIVAVPRAPTQHSHQGCTGGQCRCRGRGGPPTPPNF